MTVVTLTREQQKLVDAKDGCYLVVAPPGSGKTEVIAQRIVRLLQNGEQEEFNVLALSFTKNAAGSMRQRVTERLGEVSRRVSCTTYHAFCLDILRHYGSLAGIPSDLTIYDSLDDRIEALTQGLTKNGFLHSGETLRHEVAVRLLEGISRQQRSLIPAAATEDVVQDAQTPVSLRDAYTAYELSLHQNQALDFDGVLVQTHRLLTEQPKVARHYRLIYKYILIDEAQDTSLAQYEILKVLCGTEHKNVFMVADPAQSIYGFSGASPRFVDRFADEFQAVRHELTVTFRCAAQITAVATKLFVPSRQPGSHQQLASHSIAPGQVSYHEFSTEAKEAEAAVDWAEALCQTGVPLKALAPNEVTTTVPEQIAILARSRVHLRATLAELDARQLPYHFATGDSGLFDSAEFRAILHAFRLLANRRDVVSARTLAASLSGFGDTKALIEEADDVQLAPEVLLPHLAVATQDTRVCPALQIVAGSSAVDSDVSECVEAVLSSEMVSDDEALDELLRADRELLEERWTDYKSVVDRKDRTWQGFLMEVMSQPRPEGDGFRVLTVHAAKGLEFRAVTILGMNEGSFPDFRNSDGDALESERRLAYVAVTRAARVLRLSRPRSRMTRYGQRSQEESRFVELAGLSS